MSGIGLILLAAGASTRMGCPKQLLDFEGQTLVRRAAETALASVCRPIVVVLGANAATIRPEIEDLPVQIVENLRWQEGMASSLQAGLDSVLQSAEHAIDAVVLMLCDQPLLTSNHLDALARAYAERRCLLAASLYNEAPGVPALFSHQLFEELRALRGEEGARRVLRRHHERIVTLPFPEGALDVDFPDDLARLRAAPEP